MADVVRTRYLVTGMDCAACAAKVDRAVRRLPGVEEVLVSPTSGTMTVSPDARAGIEALKAAGVAPVMLTGDNPRAADAIAGDLGIEARAG